MASISLADINIERSKHLDTVIPFLKARDPDVVCLQELCARDRTLFESELGMRSVFAPNGNHPADPPETGGVMVGTAIMTRLPIVAESIDYYSGSEDRARSDPEHSTFADLALVRMDVEKDGWQCRIGTTHFTWTSHGQSDDRQRRDLSALFAILDTIREFVLVGDFNAPRGGEIFSAIAGRYTDNIPPHYQTSIDLSLHRNGKERPHELSDKMVDGLFSTPGYRVSDVVLHAGISDHCAITATIGRA